MFVIDHDHGPFVIEDLFYFAAAIIARCGLKNHRQLIVLYAQKSLCKTARNEKNSAKESCSTISPSNSCDGLSVSPVFYKMVFSQF